MSSLLLRLAGAQQSWGSRSRFALRSTESAPTRSGVIGIAAAALGMERTAPLDRFAALRFGVRVDQPGRLERDFQTARTLDGSTSLPLSTRHYLADAVFLVALESAEREPLEELAAALVAPAHPLYLGRRAFPPSGPILTLLVEPGIEEAFATVPWQATPRYRRGQGPEIVVETIVDAIAGDPPGDTLRDVPLSFDPRRREYGWRDVRHGTVILPNPDYVPPTSAGEGEREADHDPMDLLGEVS